MPANTSATGVRRHTYLPTYLPTYHGVGGVAAAGANRTDLSRHRDHR
jgi:hypothetical protein